MRVEIDLTDDEREAVKRFSDRKGYQISRGYAELVRRALQTRIGVDFNWGENPDEFRVVIDYGGKAVFPGFGSHVPRDRAYLVSAECREDVDGTVVDYRELDIFDRAADGIQYPEGESREIEDMDVAETP